LLSSQKGKIWKHSNAKSVTGSARGGVALALFAICMNCLGIEKIRHVRGIGKMKISKKRQEIIARDELTVRRIYDAACKRWSKDAVHRDLTRLWDLRCIWGMENILPFRSLNCQNLGELLWVAENVCGYKRIAK